MRVPLYNHHNKKLLYGSSKGNERKHDDRKAMKDLKFVFFLYCLSLHLVKTPQFHLFFFLPFFFFRYLYTRSFTLFFFLFRLTRLIKTIIRTSNEWSKRETSYARLMWSLAVVLLVRYRQVGRLVPMATMKNHLPVELKPSLFPRTLT